MQHKIARKAAVYQNSLMNLNNHLYSVFATKVAIFLRRGYQKMLVPCTMQLFHSTDNDCAASTAASFL